MDLAERYRTEAEHCLREAAQVEDRARRATWEAFARRWLELARDFKARVPLQTPRRRIPVNRATKPA